MTEAHIAALIFVTVGLVLVTTAALHAAKRSRFLAASVVATATVVEAPSDSEGLFGTVFEYTSRQGRTVRVRAATAASWQRHPIGHRLPVRYLPDELEQATIESVADLWGMPTLQACIGLFCIAVGLAVLQWS